MFQSTDDEVARAKHDLEERATERAVLQDDVKALYIASYIYFRSGPHLTSYVRLA
jgi:hypothetical protein